MHGDKGRAELGDALNALGDRIADVMQLEVEKDLLARRNQFRRKRQAAGESELIADLVEPHRIAEARGHCLGRLHRGHVESHDQAFSRV